MASRGRLPTNSTHMSLHERFSILRSAAGGQKLAGNVQGRREAAAVRQKASSKNQRLAQQMARRTAPNAATLAALKLKKKSIKQRLGATQATFSTGARLRGALTQKQRKLPGTPVRGGATASRVANNNNNNRIAAQPARRGQLNTMVVVRGGGRGRGKKSRAAAVTAKRTAPVVTTPTRRGGGRGRGRGTPNKAVTPQKPVKSGAVRGGRGGQQGKGQRGGQATASPRGKGRGAGRGRGRGGRGGGSNTPKPKLSKEELDKEMDQYMSKTRTALNRELDSYMSSTLPSDVDMN